MLPFSTEIFFLKNKIAGNLYWLIGDRCICQKTEYHSVFNNFRLNQTGQEGLKSFENSEKLRIFKLNYLTTQTTLSNVVFTFFVVINSLRTVQLESADSVKRLVCQKVSKLTVLSVTPQLF
jgi:hypothetical protein